MFLAAWVLILGGVLIAANLVPFPTVQFTPRAFEPSVSVPQISVYLPLLALALGWTGILTGAALTHMGLMLLAVLFYFVNFPKYLASAGDPQDPLQYGYAAIFWALTLLSAFASPKPVNRVIRFITLWCLCGLAADLTVQAIGRNLIYHIEVYLAWVAASHWVTAGELLFSLAAAGLLSLATAHLKAVPVFVMILGMNLASIAGYLSGSASEETASIRAAAAYMQLHTAQVKIWSDAVWFVLGANIFDFAMNFSKRTVQAIRRGLAAPWWPTVLILFCLTEIVVLARYLELPPTFMSGGELHIRYSPFFYPLWQHTAVTLLVLAAGCALMVARRLSAELALGLCGVWAFTFLVFLALYGSPRESVGLLAVGTLLWELLNGASRLSHTNSAPASAGGLFMIYLGALVVLAAQFHFDLVAPTSLAGQTDLGRNLTQIGGFEALALPILVYWLIGQWGDTNGLRRRRFIRAVIVGGLMSCVAYAARGHFGNADQIALLGNLALLAFAQILILLTALAVIWFVHAAGPIDVAVIALGCAFGFAIGYTFDLFDFAGWMLLFFGQISWQAGILGATLEAITYPPYADLMVLDTLAPVATCIALLILYGKSRPASAWSRWLGAFSIVATMIVCAAPVYQGYLLGIAPPRLGVVPDMRVLLYLGIVTLCGAYYIYRALAHDLDASPGFGIKKPVVLRHFSAP